MEASYAERRLSATAGGSMYDDGISGRRGGSGEGARKYKLLTTISMTHDVVIVGQAVYRVLQKWIYTLNQGKKPTNGTMK